MFGIMEALLSFIRRQVGLRTDAASSTGSLHAKVADLKVSIMPTQVKSWQRVTGSVNDGSDLILALSSVNPAKCSVFINGNQIIYADRYEYGLVGFGSVTRYVSAFTATSIALTKSTSISTSTGYTTGVFSVIIIELY